VHVEAELGRGRRRGDRGEVDLARVVERREVDGPDGADDRRLDGCKGRRVDRGVGGVLDTGRAFVAGAVDLRRRGPVRNRARRAEEVDALGGDADAVGKA
jgi:hypothetical protein